MYAYRPYTPESKIKEVAFSDAHSLLHYVDRRDPTGPVPDDPTRDTQYALWEEPIQKWVSEKGIANTQPPTEVDDIYTPEDRPQVTWISPQDIETLTALTSTFSVQALARRGVEKVDYYLNSVRVGTAREAPFNYTFTTSPLTPNGSYTLKAVASDDIGNETSASIRISINVPRGDSEWSIAWETPTPGSSFTPATLPSELKLTVTNPQQLNKIDFFYRVDDSSSYEGFEAIQDQTVISHTWNAPPNPGTYQLYLVVTDANGSVYTLPDTEIIILDE